MKFKDKTRGGYPVRILATDLPGDCPIAVWTDDGTVNGVSYRCRANGKCGLGADFDLIPKEPVKKTVVR